MFSKKTSNMISFDYSGKRIPIIAGNWKLHKTYAESVQVAQRIVDLIDREYKDIADIVICPSFTALRGVTNVVAFDHSFVQVGAQDCYWEDEGAFTGEVSVSQIKDLECGWCIIGHSERRELFGETSADVAHKCAALLAHDIKPMLCVGEPLAVYEEDKTIEFVVDELKASLEGVPAQAKGIVIAYEPIWAIGTGLTSSPEHAQKVAAAIRGALKELWGEAAADASRVLYGGSVRPGNVNLFTSCEDIDGVLVGGASLEAESFIDLVKGVFNA
ncbi:MAG: triose-phosphate isomerase [Coriobacteriales bacterium]|nr:triose-phosphate isomerase [Coriobacteriales bacterium]